MKMKLLSLVVVASLSLSACAADGSGPFDGMGTKQGIGGVGGAVLGGVLGSKMGKGSGQLWATGAGVMLGALLGSEIGKSLDKADLAYHQAATERAYNAPIGQPINWNNPESGHSGTVTPIREGHQGSNLCREYKQTIVVDGRAETATGIACKQADGTWVLSN